LKFVIITYTFPPQGGIGGRRWAKFSKYFHQNGSEFKVITTPPLNDHSPWTRDSQGLHDRIIYVPSRYPKILRGQPKNIWQKIHYRIALSLLRLSYNGNVYDHSLRWSVGLVPELEKLIQDGYTTIIASAGPFHYLSELASLKEIHGNNIKLIADFRDPWTNNKTSFGYSDLNNSRLMAEQKKEKSVINSFDCIVSVAEEMSIYFSSLTLKESMSGKFRTIINGFDPGELVEKLAVYDDGPIRFVFMGTLYTKVLKSIEVFSKVIKGISLKGIEFHFYGDRTEDADYLLGKLDNVYLHSNVGLQDAHSIISKASVGMLFLTDDLTYSFSTKFCEYIAYKKPIWVISKFGKTPEFILRNRIGYHSLPDTVSISLFLNEFHKNSESKLSKVDYNTFDSTLFNLKNLSDQYLELLN
jgi:glycosyltransferase involved in cell wall biosynthesis